MNFFFAVLLSSALAGLAGYKKALTKGGILTAWILCIIISFFGGLPAFAILTATFLLVIAADKLAGKRADPNGVRRKSGARDAYRVLCNVAFPSIAIMIYGINGKDSFLFAYAAVMAESLSDSLASKLGPMTKGRTIDICTFREISPGLSGGISRAGSVAAFTGALAIGTMSLAFRFGAPEYALLVALLGFSGCLFDSLLGSVAQVKYVCPACGMVTERDSHCGKKTSICKGLKPINNDMVNLCSNALVFLVSLHVFKV